MEEVLRFLLNNLGWCIIAVTGTSQLVYLLRHRNGPAGRKTRGLLSILSVLAMLYLFSLAWPTGDAIATASVIASVMVTWLAANATHMYQDQNYPWDPYPYMLREGVNFYFLSSLLGHLALATAIIWGEWMRSLLPY